LVSSGFACCIASRFDSVRLCRTGP
jgi:hypothetical protein